MCWVSDKAIKKIAERDFYVYKIGKVVEDTIFVSDIRGHYYAPKRPNRIISLIPLYLLDYTNIIQEGYHSYLTKEMAECRKYDAEIGIFEIPVGAIVYVNYKYREVVSSDIRYLGLIDHGLM